MLKIRFGAAPLVEVKMPLPAGSVTKSSQNAMSGLLNAETGNGQMLLKALLLLVNWIFPFELTLAVVNGVP